MKKMICCVAVLGMLCSPVSFAEDAPPMSPEQFYLNQASAEKFGELRKEAKGSYQGILLYPDDIRDSVLELSQYPDLVALIKNKKVLNESEFDRFLKTQPAEVQDAIAKLKAYPEVIDIMNTNIMVTSLLGAMVKDKPDETIQVIKRLSDSVKAGHTQVVTAWTDQLQKDPQAIRQLQAASEAYAKQNNLPSPNQPVTAAQAAANPNPYGYYVNESNTVIVQDMPSNDMMQYLLMNQVMYTALFAVAVSNHSLFYGDYYWNYHDEHWEDNWNEYQDNLNGISNGLNNLNNNIDENQANREQAKENWQNKKEEIKDHRLEPQDLQNNVQERRDQFQANREAGNLPVAKDINNSRLSNLDFSGQRPNVTFQSPSRDQQINRASQYHSGSWSRRSGSGDFGGARQNFEPRGGGGGERSFSGGGRGGRR